MLLTFHCRKAAALVFLFAMLSLGAAEIKNIIFFLGHGLGTESLDQFLQRYPDSNLASLGAATLTDSSNIDGKASDWAAASSALACGQKTRNGLLALDHEARPLTSLARMLQEKGWKIGLLSNGTLNQHSGTAAFFARRQQSETLAILGDLCNSRFDLIACDKIEMPGDYTEARLNALIKRPKYQLANWAGLGQLNPKQKIFLLGSAKNEEGMEAGQALNLAELCAKAIELLQNPQGFLLIVENAKFAQFAQADKPEAREQELLLLDQALGWAMKLQKEKPAETLLLFSSDYDAAAPEKPVYSWLSAANAPKLAPGLKNSDAPKLLAQAAGIDKASFEAAAKQASLPLLTNKRAQDCIMPFSADTQSITLRYGLLEKARKPLVAKLYNAEGKEIASRTVDEQFGFISFEQLQPASKYAATLEIDAQTIKMPDLQTLPQPKGKKLFSFALLSDTHVSLFPDLSYGRLHASSRQIMQDIIADLNREKVPLILHPGDLCDASLPSELEACWQISSRFQGKFIVVPGNHDRFRGEFGSKWLEYYGEPAGLQEFQTVQILSLDTGNGRLGKAANLAAIKALDPKRPCIVISHYQMLPDLAQINDKDSAVHDRDKLQEYLDKLGNSKAVIYVGHKNKPCQVQLGKVTQINAPQTTQFVDAYLLVEVYEDGLLQSLRPASDAYTSERSRRLGGAGMARAENAFSIWNQFIPWPDN